MASNDRTQHFVFYESSGKEPEGVESLLYGGSAVLQVGNH
jgi:hypothetical protein